MEYLIMNDKQPNRKHKNRSEVMKRRYDGMWLRWEYFSDVDLGIITFKLAKHAPSFPRRWVITDIGKTKQDLLNSYAERLVANE